MSTPYRPTKAGEKAFEKAIRTMRAAADALSELLDHAPPDRADDSRSRLADELREHAGYYEQATWWRVRK